VEDIIKKFKEYTESLTREELTDVLTEAGFRIFTWKSMLDEDILLLLPKVEKPLTVKFDYGKCPTCGFDLISEGCLRCSNKNFINSVNSK
jgi:hypothetical protein